MLTRDLLAVANFLVSPLQSQIISAHIWNTPYCRTTTYSTSKCSGNTIKLRWGIVFQTCALIISGCSGEQEAQLMLTTGVTRLAPFWVRCHFSLSMWPPPRVTRV